MAKTQFLCSILTIHNPSLGSCELPQKMWARLVQSFLRLSVTNKQSNRQAKYIKEERPRLKVRWKLDFNSGKLKKI